MVRVAEVFCAHRVGGLRELSLDASVLEALFPEAAWLLQCGSGDLFGSAERIGIGNKL